MAEPQVHHLVHQNIHKFVSNNTIIVQDSFGHFCTQTGYLPGALGYHVPGTSEHTIMAYANGIQRSPVNFYSNPKLVINGYRLGKDGEADAAKQMTSVRFAIAANGDESEVCQPRGILQV